MCVNFYYDYVGHIECLTKKKVPIQEMRGQSDTDRRSGIIYVCSRPISCFQLLQDINKWNKWQSLKMSKPPFIQTHQPNSMYCIRYKILWLFLNDWITQHKKQSWNAVQSLLEEDLYFSLRLLLNCFTCYKFYYSLSKKKQKKKRVELKWSLIIAQGRFRILNHTQCGLETFAWGGVWTFNRHWGRTADSISKLK